MIEVKYDSEGLMTLAQAARLLPSKGKAVAPATLWRWHVKGLNGVRLAVVTVGNTTYTTKPALDDFFARVGEAKRLGVKQGERADYDEGSALRSVKQREKDAAAAKERIDANHYKGRRCGSTPATAG